MTPALPVVLVLASGRGERFRASGGTVHKLQALLGERPVLAHTLAAVQANEALVEVMTDKATVEIPSPVEGEVLWLGAEIGEPRGKGVAGRNAAARRQRDAERGQQCASRQKRHVPGSLSWTNCGP